MWTVDEKKYTCVDEMRCWLETIAIKYLLDTVATGYAYVDTTTCHLQM